VSDTERDWALAELSQHYQAGRLAPDEFDDRSSRALRAKTGAELSDLFTDLPRSATSVPGAWPRYGGTPDRVPDRRLGPLARPSSLVLGLLAVIAIVIAVALLHGHHVGFGLPLPVIILVLIIRRRLFRRR
jgi:hypothetical protein